ncbi:hypothetical protein HPP92_004804 [Vanilla planifolia]|uniref:Uncharacterized protein n=1 Tax=Vanilla planifolia TaxID=51239 RepID=A0A835RFW0_VANPL|nr:hypothetical protein HPP92_004804 [Vanilla planifolia]
MKRSRNEAAPSQLHQSASKCQWPGRAKAPVVDSSLNRQNGALPRPASPPAAASSGMSSMDSPVEEIPFGGNLWDMEGWWWGGVEEEKLLGWFPFVDEDFSSLPAERGGFAGSFWEDYHDIWHLQHIHEIPSGEKR